MTRGRPHYNQLTGQNTDRLAALSDGVFAVAMTLLILDLHTPATAAIHGDHDLWLALAQLLPPLGVYLLSFMTLGIFWLGQQVQLNFLARGDRVLSWIHLAFLASVSLMPFSTSVMTAFLGHAPALIAYWFNILMLGLTLLIAWRYARAAGLVAADRDQAALHCAIEQRIVRAQMAYAVGTSLSLLSFWLALGVILAVQFYYVLGLTLPRRAQAP